MFAHQSWHVAKYWLGPHMSEKTTWNARCFCRCGSLAV